MDSTTIVAIDASREQLQGFVEAASDEDLAHVIDSEWTVSAFLAHTAYWDRHAAWLVRHSLQGMNIPSEDTFNDVNESALPQWRLIPPRLAAQEAVDAAIEVDTLLAELTPEQFAEVRNAEIYVDRSTHRNEHLDQIEQALSKV